MNVKLGETKLKNGSLMRVRLVEAPDEALGEGIIERLAHKGEPWVAHLRRVFEGKTDALRTFCHIGIVGGRIVGNICTFEGGPYAVLGHVYTDPNQRRQGICAHLMRVTLDEAQKRGIRVFTLGTGYDSPPYHIYRSFAFDSVCAGSGSMLLVTEPGFLDRQYTSGPAEWVEPKWELWPAVSALFCLPQGDMVRSFTRCLFGPRHYESGFISDLMPLGAPAVCLRALRTATGAVAGYAGIYPEPRWGAGTYVFDSFEHPAFAGELASLASLPWPKGMAQAYVCARDEAKLSALRQLGFTAQATLPRQLGYQGERLDVVVMGKAC